MLKNRFILSILAAAMSVTVSQSFAEWENSEVTFQGDYITMPSIGAGYKVGNVGGVISNHNNNGSEYNADFVKNDVIINVVGTSSDKTNIVYLSGIGTNGYSAIGDKTINVSGAADDVYITYLYGGVYYNQKGDLTASYAGGRGHDVEGTGQMVTLQSSADKIISINIEGGTIGQVSGGHNNGSSVIPNVINGLKAKGWSDEQLDAYLAGDTPWDLQEAVKITVSGGKVGYEADGVTPFAPSDAGVIVGAGGRGFSVNNLVQINIEGDADICGDVYAGAMVSNSVANNSGKEVQSYVKTSQINISGGVVNGNVYGGGAYQGATTTQSLVREGTEIVLAGGTVTENVYAAGDRDNVAGGTKVTIQGTGTAVGGTVHGGGNSSNVAGERLLTVDSTHKGTQDYKLADFKNIEVAGDLALESLTVAGDADGTSVDVKQGGSISTKAGVLAGLNELNVDGTLNIDMNDADPTSSAVTGKKLTLGDTATINVSLDGAGAADEIAVFGFDTMNENDSITIILNDEMIDSSLWDFTNGILIIQEASTATLNLNRNQSSFYSVVQAMHADEKGIPELAGLATSRNEAEVKAVIDSISGHEYATAMSSQIEGNLGHLRRLRGAMGKGTSLGSYEVAPGSPASFDEKGNEVMAATPAVTDLRNWRVGVSAFHDETSIDSDASGDGYDRSETGAMLNAEYYVSKGLTLGGALSYGRTNLRPDGAARRHEDNTRFDVYALYGQKRWSFATSLGMGMHEHEVGDSDVDGTSVNFMQDVAYTVLSCAQSNVQLFGTLESSWNSIDGFDGGLVQADEQDAWATDVTAGVRFNRALPGVGSAPAGVFTAQTGVTASIGDVKSGVDMSLRGYGYRQESATRNRWGWNLGAGVDVPVRSNVSLYGTVDAVLRGDSSSVDGQVGVRVSF